MEEIISMNIKQIISAIKILVLFLLFTSCGDDLTYSDGNDKPAAFRFSVNDVNTRLGYYYEETAFDDGEAIGCVIAEKNDDGTYTFGCNTKWTYRADDGMLILDSDNSYIEKDTEKNDEAYLTFTSTSGKNLQFFFYYPYVNNELLEEDFTDKTDYKSLTYPNCATSNNDIQNKKYSITLTGEVAENPSDATDAFAKYGWTEYPCFVNHTQGDVNGNYSDKRLHNSDFLWAASPEINASSATTYSLKFKKKTATVLVYSEAKLTNIYFTKSENSLLIRGNKIDLSTGELSEYTDDGSLQYAHMYFNDDEKIVPCYRGEYIQNGEQLYYYRLVLPAQENCGFKMHAESEAFTDTNIEIDLSDRLTTLEEGFLYTIRISQNGKTTIEIKDWADGEDYTFNN